MSYPIPPEATEFVPKSNALEWRGYPPSSYASHVSYLHGDLELLATDGVRVIAKKRDGGFVQTFLQSLRMHKAEGFSCKKSTAKSKPKSNASLKAIMKLSLTKEELMELLA